MVLASNKKSDDGTMYRVNITLYRHTCNTHLLLAKITLRQTIYSMKLICLLLTKQGRRLFFIGKLKQSGLIHENSEYELIQASGRSLVTGCVMHIAPQARRTARLILSKLRTAMGHRDSLYRLSCIIEMDDALVGGKRKGKRGRGAEGKTPVYTRDH